MVHIITDTTSCLDVEFGRLHHIPIIPQVINFGEESYLEGVEMDTDEFIRRLRACKNLPKTAAPPPELFVREFERLAPTGEPILCIHPSALVSGTVRSATVAAQDFPGADIRIIDTMTVASPLATLVEVAAEMAAEGATAEQIIERLESMIRRCRIYFLVDTMEYLARGGRIGGAAALLGSVLQIKPILTFRNGQVDQFERERTHKRAVNRLKDLVMEQYPHGQNGYLSVMHADAAEEGQALAEELGKMVRQTRVPVAHVPPAIVTHGGPGILGVGFFTKS
jgi:DegV family protein with EDD domain